MTAYGNVTCFVTLAVCPFVSVTVSMTPCEPPFGVGRLHDYAALPVVAVVAIEIPHVRHDAVVVRRAARVERALLSLTAERERSDWGRVGSRRRELELDQLRDDGGAEPGVASGDT
jgi:hypothetical protein